MMWMLLAPAFSLWGFATPDDCELMRRESARIAQIEISQMACVAVPTPMPRPRPRPLKYDQPSQNG
jgi:hypothetical protein